MKLIDLYSFLNFTVCTVAQTYLQKSKSKFYLCQNRDGSNSQVVDDAPGNIVILPATGFKMINNDFVRPIHFVSDITDGRLSVGLRQNIELK